MRFLTKPRFNWIDSLNTVQLLVLHQYGAYKTAIITTICIAMISAILETKYWSKP